MKIAVRFVAVVAGLSSFASIGATAQTPASRAVKSGAAQSPIDRDPNSYRYSPQESDREFAAYSNCVIKGSPGQRNAAAFLRLVPNNAAWAKAGQKLTSPECLRTSFGKVTMRYNLTALRPALFAAMYRSRFGRTPPSSFADDSPLALDAMYDGSVADFPPQALTQLNFGNCVARADTVAVHRLLMARPWSDAEDAALPAVTKALGGCVPKDQTLRLNRSSVRGVVAEAMYQLASARASGASSAAASAPKGQ